LHIGRPNTRIIKILFVDLIVLIFVSMVFIASRIAFGIGVLGFIAIVAFTNFKSALTWLICLSPFTIPFEAPFYLNSTLVILEAILAIIFIVSITIGKRKIQAPHVTPFVLALMSLYLASLVLSNLFSLDIKAALRGTYYVVLHVIFLILVVSFFNSPSDRLVLLKKYSKAILVLSIYAIIQYFFGGQDPLKQIFVPSYQFSEYIRLSLHLNRITGTFLNYNTLAAYLVLTIPFVLSFAQNSSKRKELIAWLTTGMVMSLALFLTFSRSGLLAFVVILVLFLILRQWRPVFGLILVILMITPFVMRNVPINIVLARIRYVHEDLSTLGRLFLWKSSLQVINRHLITGVGMGNFFEATAPLLPNFIRFSHFEAAHNIFLQKGVEVGLLGTFGFFGVIIIAIKNCYRTFRSNLMVLKIISLGTFGSLLAFLVCGLFDSVLHDNVYLLLLMLVVAFAISTPGTEVESVKASG